MTLFKVFSPTGETLANGAIIAGIDDYLQRLTQNNPGKAAAIEAVRVANLVRPRPQQDHWRWCVRCQGLFFGGNASQGFCAAGGAHDRSGSAAYFVRHF